MSKVKVLGEMYGIEITKPWSNKMYEHNDSVAEAMKQNIIEALNAAHSIDDYETLSALCKCICGYGMSNQLLKKNFKLLVVNSMNKKFNVDKWNESKTAFLSNQDNLVISDHRTRQFDTLNVNQKKHLSKLNWGVFNL